MVTSVDDEAESRRLAALSEYGINEALAEPGFGRLVQPRMFSVSQPHWSPWLKQNVKCSSCAWAWTSARRQEAFHFARMLSSAMTS